MDLHVKEIFMRIKLLMLIITTTCVYGFAAEGYAQKITLSVRNQTLEAVLREIRLQSGFNFVSDPALLKQAKPVTLQVRQEELETVLEKCFADQPFTYSISKEDKAIALKEKGMVDKVKDFFGTGGRATDEERGAPSQDGKTITGRVIDSLGTPLANATIRVKGTSRATFTNKNGEFTLRGLDPTATLQISFLGFTTREITASGIIGSIILYRATSELEEAEVMVNTGYQTIPKERSTGSFSQVDNKLFNQQVSTDILSRLPAVANGVYGTNSLNQPNQILIRGLSTINGPTAPLIILDNFPYEGDLKNLNPNTVESVTILKDAAAASIWGTKAGNGVIVITTKKAHYGQKPKLEFNSNFSSTGKPQLDKAQVMSSKDFIDVEKFLFSQKFYDGQERDTYNRPALSPVVELLIKARDGLISQDDANSQIDAMAAHDVRDDFEKYVYRNSANQQYALTLSGGNKSIAYLFSGGFDKDIDNLSADYNRINFHSQNTFNPTEKLNISLGLTYTQSKTYSGKQGYGSISQGSYAIPPYSSLIDDNGKPAAIAQLRQPFIDTIGGGKLLDWNYYPLSDYKYVHNNGNIQDIVGNIGATYQINRWLAADVKYQYEKQNSVNNNLNDLNSYAARNPINSYSVIGNDGNVTYAIPKGAILNLTNGTLEAYDLRGQLNLNKTFGRHEINAIAGSEVREAKQYSNSGIIYGYDPDLLTSGLVDYVNPHRNIINGASGNFSQNNNFTSTTNRFVSFYANAAYTYMGHYTVSLSGRRDASNLFGVSTNDKWTPLWSSGLSWLLSDESFYHSRILPYLKLRATFGFSGNVDQNRSALTTIQYSNATTTNTDGPASIIRNIANPELRWEKVQMLNLGLDFRLLSNILTGSIDYYQKKGVDLYGTVPIDYTAGIRSSTVTRNVASMSGKGMDINVNANIFQQTFKWTAMLNLSLNKDKIVSYYLPVTMASQFVSNAGARVTGLEGKPVHAIFSYKYAGLDADGNPQGYLNGTLSEDYRNIQRQTTLEGLVYNGPVLPTTFGSLGNTFSYGPVSLTFQLTYKVGNYFKRRSISYSDLFSSYSSTHADFEKRWQKPGDELTTNIPSMIYPVDQNRDAFYAGSDYLVSKGDNIRLQFVNLSFTILRGENRLLPFSSVSIYANASDLGIIWKADKQVVDPDYQSYPLSKTCAIGLRGNF
ncbi:TonB-linked outer membrane protein, SusC/RagA family [bacterium A37T11]|nr:TonB-linked outer membrane protein, SusC/RagA family [bacterium A37T11]